MFLNLAFFILKFQNKYKLKAKTLLVYYFFHFNNLPNEKNNKLFYFNIFDENWIYSFFLNIMDRNRKIYKYK